MINQSKYVILIMIKEGDILNVSRRNDVTEEEIQRMIEDIAEEITETDLSKLKRLGIDEIALVKGQKNYCAVLVNLDTGKLIAILEKRTQEELRETLTGWGKEVLEQIEEVSIDLWLPYKNLVKELMPSAEVVADRFHVMKQINEELDKARKSAKREIESSMKKAKSKKNKQALKSQLEILKNSKYVLLKNREDLEEEEVEKLDDIVKNYGDLGSAYRLKEKLRQGQFKNEVHKLEA